MTKSRATESVYAPRHRHPHGFTLIELLVVVAIIVTLIAILMPALSSARDSAVTVKCLNNLKQIYTSQVMYSTEYNGRMLVRKYASLPLPNGTMGGQTWLQYLNVLGYIPGGGKYAPTSGGQVVFSARSVGVCPRWGFMENTASPAPSWQWIYQGTYGTNAHVADEGAYVRYALISQPADVMLAADKASIGGSGGGIVATTSPIDLTPGGAVTASPSGTDVNYQVGVWHGRQTTNIVYYDGHAANVAKVPSAGGWNTRLYHPPLPWSAGDNPQAQ